VEPDDHDAHAAHTDHTGHEAVFRQRFWICLALSVPVLLFSPMLQQWLGFAMPTFPGSRWIAPLISIVIFAYGGTPFLRMATGELRTRQPGMMTLISLAIVVAFAYSLAALSRPGAASFFWELVTLIDVMLLGHWIEMRSVRRASGALDELAALLPDRAERLADDGSIETVPADDLATGDRVLVRPGAAIPADGEIEDGSSVLDESMITGESRPASRSVGEAVIGGTVNAGNGSLRVRITATGDETALAGIMRLVAQAQQSKSRTQLLADRAAAILFYVALAVALLTAVAWTVVEGPSFTTLERVVTVLVIACPHALGLAVPLVVAISTTLAARNGILVRDRLAFEAARQVDIVLFDKTGTLTEGRHALVGQRTIDGREPDDVLALAAAVEADSEHGVAAAIRAEAEKRDVPTRSATDFTALKGRGVHARVDGQDVYVGGPRLLEHLGIALPAALAEFTTDAGARGQSVIHVITEGEAVSSLAMGDVIRPSSRAALDRLREMGIEVAMLTGDSRDVAQAVAEELGMTRFFAEVLPSDKADTVAKLQGEGKRVAMVGDGVNDAPALARADVGLAIGGGTNVAIESAGIVLVESDPRAVADTFVLGRASHRKMVQNLVWATAYNLVALPLAAGVLAPWGILLSPAVGALFMSASTVIVAANAQLLRRVELGSNAWADVPESVGSPTY
jgi:Cu2+-exporting ATPase